MSSTVILLAQPHQELADLSQAAQDAAADADVVVLVDDLRKVTHYRVLRCPEGTEVVIGERHSRP